MRKTIFVVLLISSIFLFNGCGVTSKEDIISIVDTKSEDLNEIVKQFVESDKENMHAALEGENVESVETIQYYHYESGNPIIEFCCESSGFVSNSSYYGFYYSFDGKPVGYQGMPVSLREYEDGWSGEMDGNTYYTEQIKEKWYYYEMHF